MEKRWALALQGDGFDLEDAELLFRDGSAIKVEKVDDLAGRTWTALFAHAFEDAVSAADVNEMGRAIVDRLNGVLFVRDPGRKPVTINAVLSWQTADPPKPAGFVGHGFLAGTFAARSRMRGSLSDACESVAPPMTPLPPEREWLSNSFTDTALEDVLTHLRGAPDWFDLWKAFEVMRADIQDRSCKRPWHQTGVAWPRKEEVDRFTGSVNHHRHSRAHPAARIPAAERMGLREAQLFLARLVAPWRTWRTSAACCGDD